MQKLRLDYTLYMDPVYDQLQELETPVGFPISDEELQIFLAFLASDTTYEEDSAALQELIAEAFNTTVSPMEIPNWLITKGFSNLDFNESITDFVDLLETKFVTLSYEGEEVSGRIEKVDLNRYTGEIFVTLLTSRGLKKIRMRTLDDCHVREGEKEITLVPKDPIVQHECEFLLAYSAKKPFDDHFRIFTLCSALTYQVTHDEKNANYAITLKYDQSEKHIVESVLLQICKKIEILTPEWVEWLNQELAAINELYR